MRQLEDWSGQTLFERVGNAMRLTAEGRELLARLGGPLAALHEAVYPAPDEAVSTLQIATLGSLARAWLLPRLHGFIAAGAILFAYGALFTTAAVYQRRSRSGSE